MWGQLSIRSVSRAAAAAATLFAATAALADTRVALVVGNADYQHVRKLANPVNDARAMRAALEKVGFQVVFGENLAKRELERTIGSFARAAKEADVALVYYSGHGSTFGEVPYLVPVDARYDSLEEIKHELVPVEAMVGELRRAKGVRIALLDACRDNEAEQALKSAGGATRGLAEAGGLGKVSNPDGLIIAYSTQPLRTALDGDPGANSPFTSALLRQLPTPGLDVKAMLFKTAEEVVKTTRGGQRPEIQVSLYQDYALVAGKAEPAAEAARARPVAAGAAEEALFWQTLRARVTRQGLQDYLARVDKGLFPGTFTALAREELALFEEAAARRQTSARLAERAAGDGAAVDCDWRAAHPDDPDRPAGVPGVSFELLDPEPAIAACRKAVAAFPQLGRFTFQLGRAQEKKGELAEARRRFESAAAAGSVAAMTSLGRLYQLGTGAAADPAKARLWYERAIALGHAPALNNLAILVEKGEGGPQDARRASALFLESVRRGNAHTLQLLKDKPELFSLGVRAGLQALLAEDGLLAGESDGTIGPRTVAALDEVARSRQP